MIDTAARPGRPLDLVLARIALAALVGLVVLPSLFATSAATSAALTPRSPDSTTAAIWLSLAGIVTIWLFFEARALAVALARHVPGQRAARPVVWVVALVAIGVVQAVLRRPFVAVLGGWTSAGGADVAFAVASLLVVVVTLALLHLSAVPLVTTAVRGVLDALVPTVEADGAEEPSPTAAGAAPASARPEPVPVATIDEATTTVAVALVVGAMPVDVSRPAATPDGADETVIGALSAETLAASTNGTENSDVQEAGRKLSPDLPESYAGATIVARPPAAETGTSVTSESLQPLVESDAGATLVERQPAVVPTGGKRAPAQPGVLPGGSRDV